MDIEIKIDKLITKPIDISKSELKKNKSIVEAKMIKMLTELVMQSK